MLTLYPQRHIIPGVGGPGMQIYQQPIEQMLSAVGTDGKRGLPKAEAKGRLDRYGRNELQAGKRTPAWKKFS